MQPMKETASNIAASAKSGMDKTKATVQEKVERMTSKDPVAKEEATMKKDARIQQAELEKQEARAHNAATGPHSHTTTGPTGTHQASALPGHGTEGVVGSHPVGLNTGTGRTTAHNDRVGGTGTHTGTHQVSALPGHGTGHVTEGVVGSHPEGLNTGTGRTTAHNDRVGGTGPHSYTTTGPTGTHNTDTHQVSALPGHGTGHLTEGEVGSHPVGLNTGTGRAAAHNDRVGGTGPTTHNY